MLHWNCLCSSHYKWWLLAVAFSAIDWYLAGAQKWRYRGVW